MQSAHYVLVEEMTGPVREALRSMGSGDISFSPYDTAWVALVKKQDGGEGPQFPSCIDWIAKNQLRDGSWGDDAFFLVQDRLINTCACVIALKTWNVHRDKCNRGRGVNSLSNNQLTIILMMTFLMELI